MYTFHLKFLVTPVVHFLIAQEVGVKKESQEFYLICPHHFCMICDIPTKNSDFKYALS